MKTVAKRTKIAIIWANPYNRNLGVAALAYSALSMFHDIAKESKLDVEITFVGSSYSDVDSILIGSNSISFNNIIGLDYLNWKSWVKILLNPSKYKIFKLLKFDYIFDLGEGDSFSDLYGDRRYYRIYNSKRMFSFLGKKQVLLPQTIGPFHNTEKEKASQSVMRKLHKVISRDSQSYNYTASFLEPEKIVEMIDLAFYMPFSKVKFNHEKVHIGINISGLLWNGGYTRDNQFNMKADYKKLIHMILAFFGSQPEVQVHLIPHVIPDNNPVEDDWAVSMLLKEEFPQVIVAPKFVSPVQAKGYISGMDFFTGARMHACIAAFSVGVPVIPLAYSRKFNGLFADTLDYNVLGDCVNNSEEVIMDQIENAYIGRARLANEIKDRNDRIVGPRLKVLKTLLNNIINNK
jgi:colanic acid/amylovoran biosynthesis protein